MNKQVLISVRPENAVNILNGSKTIELCGVYNGT